MSLRYWLHHPAVIGTGVAAGLLVLAAISGVIIYCFWPAEPKHPEYQSLPSRDAYVAEMLSLECVAILSAVNPDDADPKQAEDCADKAAAQKKNYADLVQSARSADATERATYLVYLQTCIGIVGLILVVLSFSISSWAAISATQAARGGIDAAQLAGEGLKLARREFNLLHRPRLRIRRVRIQPPENGKPLVVEAIVANVGGTAAMLRGRFFWIKIAPESPESQTFDYNAEIQFIEAGATAIVKFTTDTIYGDHLRRPEVLKALVTRGILIYADTYGGGPFDIESHAEFRSVQRRAGCERIYAHPTMTGHMRFVRGKEPDPEYEYED